MKKVNTHKKLILKKRARKSHRRKLNFKEHQKAKKKKLLNLNTSQRNEFNFFEKYYGYAKIKAPDTLSMVRNPEETIQFITSIKKQFDKNQKVFLILKHVKYIGYDALVVLLSILIRFKSKGIDFDGNIPESLSVKTILHKSGFLKYLNRKIKEEERYELIKKGTISTHASKKVDAELTHQIISYATKHIWEQTKRCQGVQRSLIELMHNTNNHAAYESEGEKHWFLSVQHIENEKKVCFSFIDFGVGIFESLNNKREGSKWHDWYKSLEKLFTIDNNKELLKLILNGSLHKTVTGKYYRGKGLPGIYDAYKRNHFSNLHIISNDVFANVQKNEFQTLKNEFSGTFVYWELNEKNINRDGINKN